LPVCKKTTANCSNCFCHVHLISSVSRPQRPLIFYVNSVPNSLKLIKHKN
jgi:hypothetical protein